jgi:crotonobetainyl-CoA:carnitine CoA-transferase CaiB-like acyl-CoA transferase
MFSSNSLSGLVVADFSRLLPGPLLGQMLRQQGAMVYKIEHPAYPDPVKQQPPFLEGRSTLYQLLNEGKEAISLDYTQISPELDALLGQSDVLIESFRPGIMAQWGLSYAQLQARYPRLIYISLTGYGQTGPQAQVAGHDLNYLAESGVLHLCRDEQGRPVLPAFQIADVLGGSYQALAACALALYARSQTGKGQYLDISMTEGLAPLLVLPQAMALGQMPCSEYRLLNGGLVNYNVYRCADDRWVALAALELKFWNRFCVAVQRLDWQREGVWELSTAQFPYAEVQELFLSQTAAQWLERLQGVDCCFSVVVEKY